MNRRRFCQVAASAAANVGLLAVPSRDTIAAVSRSMTDETQHPSVDYGRAFIVGKAPWNRVRFLVESRTRIIDERRNRYENFYQCAACQSENTFADRDLFKTDTTNFTAVFGPMYGIKFRRPAHFNPGYRQVYRAADLWGGQVYHLPQPLAWQLVSTNERIRHASHEGLPLVGQTEIVNLATGLRAIIEFPIKTINIHDGNDRYQVDTGPVVYPDLSRRYTRLVDSLSLAFVAFNAPSFADFVIEDVTPIVEGGREVTRVHHYSRILSVPATNRVFATSLATERASTHSRA